MKAFIVSPEQKATFEEDGFVVFHNVLEKADIQELIDRIDGLLEGRYDSDGFIAGPASTQTEEDVGRLIKQVMPTTWRDGRLYIKDRVLNRISKHPTLTSIAAQLLGDEEVWLFQQQALLKDPGDPNPTPWHQDDHYWQTGGRAITAWFPLEPVSKENGTMSLVPGSHKWEVLEHVRAKGASLFRTVKENLDNSMFVPLELRPGSVSFHHSKTIHGAFANMGSVRRIALAQHYVSPRDHLLLVERRAERRKKAELDRTRKLSQ
jgi:phytanoyl-CoA hydroxylase